MKLSQAAERIVATGESYKSVCVSMGINLDTDGKFMGSRGADYQALKTVVRTVTRRTSKQGINQLQRQLQTEYAKFQKVTNERDRARQLVSLFHLSRCTCHIFSSYYMTTLMYMHLLQVTQLTNRAVKAEQQLEDEKSCTNRAVKKQQKAIAERDKTKQAFKKVRVRSEDYRRMYGQFQKLTKERDRARQLVSLFHLSRCTCHIFSSYYMTTLMYMHLLQVTQLTNRAVKAEQQLEDEKSCTNRAVKKQEKAIAERDKTKQAFEKVRVRSEDYRRMSSENAQLKKVTKERDEARQLVSLFHLPTHVILYHHIILVNTLIYSLQVTQLTNRAVKAEQQLKDEKSCTNRAVKKQEKVIAEWEKTKQAFDKVRVRSEDYRRMSSEYARVVQDRDRSLHNENSFRERNETIKRELRTAKANTTKATKRADNLQKDFWQMHSRVEKFTDEVTQLTNRAISAEKRAISAEKQADDARVKSSELLDKLKSSVQPVCTSRKHLACHTWEAVANVLNMDATDKKKIRKAAKHMHDTLSEDWHDSLEKKTDMSSRLPSAVRLLHKHLFSCVRVKNNPVPIDDIIRFVFKVDNSSSALDEIRKAVQAAVAERRLGDAKVLLTLSLSSFKGRGRVQAMKRYFTHVQPVLVGSKVTFLAPSNSPLKRDRKIACRNYSYNSTAVSRGTVMSISADRKTIRVKNYLPGPTMLSCACSDAPIMLSCSPCSHATMLSCSCSDAPIMLSCSSCYHFPGHDKATITKMSATRVHHDSNIYVNEDLLNSAQQYERYLGAGVPPVESPAVENHVISLSVLKHFIEWIFSPIQTNVLKARGHDGERGCTHELKDFAARTWKPYRDSAEKGGLKGISQGDTASSTHTTHTTYSIVIKTHHPYT